MSVDDGASVPSCPGRTIARTRVGILGLMFYEVKKVNRGPTPPTAKGGVGPTVTIQQDPKDGLEVLSHNLPQCKGFSGCLREQTHKENDGVFWW